MYLESCKIENLFDLNETIAKELFAGKVYPWEVLSDIKDFILELGPKLDPKKYHRLASNIWAEKTAVIAPSSHLSGPLIIDAGSEIRPCAFIRGSAIIGKNCVVGNSTELKNSILFNNVEAPHYNYVGDSILGFHAHMGAGSITSNIKADRKNIVIKDGADSLETGLRKIGAILGDYVEVGCNAVLNPGTVIGPYSNVYPLSMVRGVVPGNCIVKNAGQLEIVTKE